MTNPCPHFPACGGCDFQDKTYEEQLQYKRTFCRNLVARFCVKEHASIIASPHIHYYRNKMDFCAGQKDGRMLLGMRRKMSSSDVVDIGSCNIFCRQTGAILSAIRQWATDAGYMPYRIYRHTGVLRYASIRHAKSSDQLLVVIVVALNQHAYEQEQEKFQALAGLFNDIPKVKSLYLCLNSGLADDTLTENLHLLSGEAYLIETINGLRYAVNPTIFLQANPYAAAKLYEHIRQEAGGGTILDMYCASAGITLQLANGATRIIGVDNSPANIRDAHENALRNAVNNAEFVCVDADEFLSQTKLASFDTVIVDPPREGLTEKARQAIMRARVKKLVYVSCNPLALREDLKVLTGAYAIERICPVDMFPQTRHIEIVATLVNPAPRSKE